MVNCKHEAPECSIVNTMLLPFGTHSLSHTFICTHACICKPYDDILDLPFVLLTLTVHLTLTLTLALTLTLTLTLTPLVQRPDHA